MKRVLLVAAALILVVALAVMGYALFTTANRGREVPTAASLVENASQDSVETVILLHTNDFHGAIEPAGQQDESGGLVNLVSAIDQVRAEDPEHTILLDAGDTLQGTYVSNSTHGEVVVAAMNLAGYDAWTPGNHEFDWGQETLRERIGQASFSVLAANLLDADTGETWDAVEPYTILHAGRARIAVVGMTYPDTPTINRPENVAGLDFVPAAEAVQLTLPQLEGQADLVVVLSHLGLDGDRALAQSVDGIDVIVGGHSHVYLDRPQKVKSTLLVQAGEKGRVLGRLELVLNLDTGEVIRYGSGDVLLPVGGASVVNVEASRMVEAALADAKETMDQPIGEMARPAEPRRSGEFSLGNLVVDAMLAADMGDGQQADIAMHNNGGIRDGLPRGPITFGELYAVLPFDNQLMAMDLTGAQVLRILEHSVSERPGAMQVAGLTFRFNQSKPVGERVVEATVGGEPLDPNELYRVVTIDYLASGGDGYEDFLEGDDSSYGDTEVWAVAEYIREHSPIDPKVDGRIQR